MKKLHELNSWLIHACQCPDAACRDAVHKEHCGFMKLCLTNSSWLLHGPDVRSTTFAEKLAKLFAYHILHCNGGAYCVVPFCNLLRTAPVNFPL
jgi:hypothetical protein